jgi:HEAT repeat protein
MNRHRNSLLPGALIIMLLICMVMATPARAYVDLAPTLAKVMTDSKSITVVEVKEFDRAKRIVVLKEIRALKGELTGDVIRHEVVSDEKASIPRPILQWAGSGATAVLFGARNTTLVCIGQGWYQARLSGAGGWKLGKERPDLPLAYYGSVSRLADAITRMLAGKDAIITVVAQGGDDDQAASFDLALNRTSLPELVRIQRARVNMNMASMVMAASSNPGYFIGMGAVDEDELPSLLEKLKSADSLVRADAAFDLRRLGSKAKTAQKALASLLNDSTPRARFAAAAALLRIDPKDTRGLEPLTKGLNSTDPAQRCFAAEATGLAGPAAGGLASKLAALLKDADESTRIAALQAIATLGPAASKAAPAVASLLDNPEMAVDAADALGRIGPAARPVPGQLAKMLLSDQSAVQWAAVRAMSQIGGEEARPVVEFMIRALPRASEMDGYNMMIYLALLGPVAQDASNAIRNAPIKNPVLPSLAQWAVAGGTSLPWQSGGGRGFGGMGGPGGGPGDISTILWHALIREMGERLRPTARLLAQKIMDGTAGNIPTWGYDILACAPDEAIGLLAPRLVDENVAMRERATVALGYMGAAASSARERVAAALGKASSEHEKHLLEWCLREIDQG